MKNATTIGVLARQLAKVANTISDNTMDMDVLEQANASDDFEVLSANRLTALEQVQQLTLRLTAAILAESADAEDAEGATETNTDGVFMEGELNAVKPAPVEAEDEA